MSQSTEFETLGKSTRGVYELMGNSGKTYVFYFFADGSVTAARKAATRNRAVAKLEFDRVNVKNALRDCGIEVDGTTYQKGQALLRELERPA